MWNSTVKEKKLASQNHFSILCIYSAEDELQEIFTELRKLV